MALDRETPEMKESKFVVLAYGALMTLVFAVALFGEAGTYSASWGRSSWGLVGLVVLDVSALWAFVALAAEWLPAASAQRSLPTSTRSRDRGAARGWARSMRPDDSVTLRGAVEAGNGRVGGTRCREWT